ncbi:hypothetical protein [Nocardia sp. NPDC057455]|uniref:hypothetical protein n=1 Tax=Nocardia sp. NPDC057455 TaxID=3346138 RepID=UPI003672835D
MSDDLITATCTVCGTGIHWIECPTGGWWAHEVHPADHHDAATLVEVEEDMTNDGWWITVGIKGGAA